MRVIHRAALAACIALSGCAATPETATRISDSSLCAQYGTALRTAPALPETNVLRQEIHRRALLLPTDDDGRIAKEVVRIGDSECALYASWGTPSRAKSNDHRERHAHPARPMPASPGGTSAPVRTTFYTTNGRVTVIQN